MKAETRDKIFEFFFPEHVICCNCGDELRSDKERELRLCDKCHKGAVCLTDEDVFGLPNCDKTFGVYVYDGTARNIVLKYKDGDRPDLTRWMANILARKYEKQGINCDIIAYIPSNKSALKRRGYDALGLVAKYLGEKINKPVLMGATKKENVLDQTQVAKEHREENVKGVFSLGEDSDLYNKRVLLIDDVVTTGATITEFCKVLRFGGAVNVECLCFSMAVRISEGKNS